jgi:hypothetical protein
MVAPATVVCLGVGTTNPYTWAYWREGASGAPGILGGSRESDTGVLGQRAVRACEQMMTNRRLRGCWWASARAMEHRDWVMAGAMELMASITPTVGDLV